MTWDAHPQIARPRVAMTRAVGIARRLVAESTIQAAKPVRVRTHLLLPHPVLLLQLRCSVIRQCSILHLQIAANLAAKARWAAEDVRHRGMIHAAEGPEPEAGHSC